MAKSYQLGRVERRLPALPADDLCFTVARQFGELPAIHMGLGHRARQALADTLLLGDVVLPEHSCASLLLGLSLHLTLPCEAPMRGKFGPIPRYRSLFTLRLKIYAGLERGYERPSGSAKKCEERWLARFARPACRQHLKGISLKAESTACGVSQSKTDNQRGRSGRLDASTGDVTDAGPRPPTLAFSLVESSVGARHVR
jgi:hypothetical protein